MAQPALELGFGAADITPGNPSILSGFIFRENRLFERIDDPLSVRALAVRHGAGTTHLLLNYDVLGISRPLHDQILAALAATLADHVSLASSVLTTTHAHSAPPTSPLQGEAAPDPAYWQLICDRTVHAAHEACRHLTPVSMSIATLRVPGLTYNRRAVLADGRVSMTLEPDAPVLERGPVDDTLTLLVWRDQQARNVASLVHFACHGVAMCEQAVTADIPGHLAARLGQMLDAPCLFLQGATGDVNPTTVSGDRGAMLDWLERAMEYVQCAPGQLLPLPCTPLRVTSTDLPLCYQDLPARSVIARRVAELERIAQGDLDAPDVQESIQLLGGIMNFGPGERPDPAKASFAARAMADAERRTLDALDAGAALPACPLRICLWRMGQVTLAFVAAELFASSGYRIRSLGKGQALLPVTYASPIVGYVPDRAAMQKGGYEVDDAWRFYRQPAPFAAYSEQRIVDTIAALASGL